MIAVDTNVLLYAIDDSEPEKSRQALAPIEELTKAAQPLVLLWQVAAEFLAGLRRWENLGRIRRIDTEIYVHRFLGPLQVLLPTEASLRMSLDLSARYRLSHWDALLLAACHEAGVITLFSEDLSHGMKYDAVTVVNPFRL